MKLTTKTCLAFALSLPLIACSENKAASTSSIMEAAKEELPGSTTDLTEVSKSIADLEKTAAGLSGEAKTNLEGLLPRIKTKYDEVAKLVSELQTSPVANDLAGLKTKITDAMTELKKMISEATAAAK